MMAGASVLYATAFVGGGVQDVSNDACSSKATMISAAIFVDGGLEDVPNNDSSSVATIVAAAVFVEGGVQDSYDDACSICLEDFCENSPSTITNCNHEYHLHCILEWSQRGKECPMCWQALSLKDPESQTLLAASQQQRGALDLSSIRQLASLERHEEVQPGRSSNASLSETFTFKSRLAAASFKYRNSFSKTTRGLRERLRLGNYGTFVDSRATESRPGAVRSSRDGEQ